MNKKERFSSFQHAIRIFSGAQPVFLGKVNLNFFPEKTRPYVILPVLVVLLTAAVIVMSNAFIKKPEVHRFIIERISDAMGFDIRTKDIKLNLSHGIGIFINGLEARSSERSENIVASKVIIVLDAGQLLRGNIVPMRLYLFQPKIELAMEAGQLSLKTEGNVSEGAFPTFQIPGIQSVVVDGGFVQISDIPFYLEDFYLNVEQRSPRSEALTLSGQGKIGYREEKVPFNLKGSLFQYEEKQKSPYADMTIETGKVPTSWIIWPESIPVTRGAFAARLNMSGSLAGPISVDGYLSFETFRFLLREGKQEKDYSFSNIKLDFKSVVKSDEISVPSIQLRTDEVSLSIAFMLDLKQDSPYLNLEVKSPFMALDVLKTLFPTPILPPWIETQLFPMLDTGYARLNLLSLKGKVDQIENLDLPQNQDALTVKFSCKNVTLFGRGLVQPVTEIAAEIDFEKGILGISGLGASFGRSVVREAGLGIEGLYGDHPSYKASLGGSFDLHDLKQQMEMDLIPDEVRRWSGRVQSVTGNIDAQVTLLYETGWRFPQVTSGEFLLRNAYITQKDLIYPLAFKGAEIRIDEEDRGRINGIGSWGDSKFKITGVIGLKGGRFDLQRVDVYSEADYQEILPFFYRQEKSPFIFRKAAPLQISIQKGEDGWSGKGLVSLEGVVVDTNDYFIDPPGSQDRIIFDFNMGPQGRLDIKKGLLKLGGSLLELSNIESLPKEGAINLKASLPSFSLADLGLYFKKGSVPALGHLHGQIEASISRRKPSATRITGALEGKDILFQIQDFPAPINRCNFEVGFSGTKITIESWKMRIGRSRLDIRGDLNGWDGLKGALTAGSTYLNVADFWSDQTPPSSERGKVHGRKKIPKRDIRVKLDVQRGIWKKMKWGPLNASLNIKGDGFQIRQSNVKMEHGFFTLKGHVRDKIEPAIILSSYIRLHDQPLEDVLDTLDFPDRQMKGTLTMEAILHMKGEKPKDLIANLAASSNILIEEGVVKDAGVMFKVLEFLSLQKIFKRRPPNISKDGFYFHSVQWHAAVSRGQLKTDNFLLKSPAFNAVASGKMDLVGGNLDFDLGAQPLMTIDTIVSSIPILGYILTGEEKAILTYYFKVEGPLADPKVTYVPFKNLGTGVADTLKRLFLTPVRIFKDIAASSKDSHAFDDTDIPSREDMSYR